LLDARARARLLKMLGRCGDPRVSGMLARYMALGADAGDATAAGAAVNSGLRLEMRSLVPQWVELIDHRSSNLRRTALWAIQALANHLGPVRDLETPADRRSARQYWQQWWVSHRGESNDQWILAGFNKHNVEIASFEDNRAIPKLMDALTTLEGPMPVTAHRTLVRMTGHWRIGGNLGAKEQQRRWKKWWRRNRKRFKP